MYAQVSYLGTTADGKNHTLWTLRRHRGMNSRASTSLIGWLEAPVFRSSPGTYSEQWGMIRDANAFLSSRSIYLLMEFNELLRIHNSGDQALLFPLLDRSVPTAEGTAPAGQFGPQAASQDPISNAQLLRHLQEYLMRSSWLRNNEPEPPLQPEDPFVNTGLLATHNSRFDAFVTRTSTGYACTFAFAPGQENCTYTNTRRGRVIAHIFKHFSYTPCLCKGSCGNPGCTMGFADGELLGEHVRRSGKSHV